MVERKMVIAGVVVGTLLLFSCGILCGYVSRLIKTNHDISKILIENIDKENIKAHLHHLTDKLGWKTPGTRAEHNAANYILDYWKSIGLSNVKALPYDILLNYPDENQLNSFQILDEDTESVVFEANHFESLRDEGSDDHLQSLFLANSFPGVKKGKILYVNYARSEDFKYLAGILPKNLSEYICLARYGKLARGIKAKIAEQAGCKALILYSDPVDYNPLTDDLSFPKVSWRMPESSVQRGTIKTPYKGLADLLTPGYPAIEGAFRLQNHDTGLPKIPVHVLRSDDVRTVFTLMNSSKDAPPKWQGRMSILYGIGGDFTTNRIVGRLSVATKNSIGTTFNVFGFLEGKEEKDRYVIVGNHYDSWGPGAVDPSIGMSALMELSRTFMQVHNYTGWRPRRSILFCAWGAEEIGSIGSREFVEEYEKVISLRAVAYLNVDVATLGNYSIKVKSQALLKEVILKSLKAVQNPDESEMSKGHLSLYETYVSRFTDKNDVSKPLIKFMNTGSDYVHFIGLTGVPCLDLRYTYDESTGIDFYPLYHTAYDNSRSFETFIDPSYKFTKAVAQLWGELTFRLSDEKIIPFSIAAHISNIDHCVQILIKRLDIKPLNKWTKALMYQMHKLEREGKAFENSLNLIDLNDELAIRQKNDQMMTVEKALFYQEQLKDQEGVRHSLHSPSLTGKQICFSRVNDLLDEVETIPEIKLKIEEELSKIITFLQSSVTLLKDPGEFLKRNTTIKSFLFFP